MIEVDFGLDRGGTELKNYVVSYEREALICSGVSTLDVQFTSNVPVNLISGESIVLYENGNKQGTFYITNKNTDANSGIISISCLDGSKWLQDYFIDDLIETEPGHNARYWLQYILDIAGVTLFFAAANDGIEMDAVLSLGMQTAYDAVTTLCQQNGWFFTFLPDGECFVGSVEFSPSTFSTELAEDDILSLEVQKDDEMLRNRAVVWGSGDPEADEGWVFSDKSVNTAWNRDTNDIRTVAIANGAIGSREIADAMAYQILHEFARITVVKTIKVHGLRTIALTLGVKVIHDLFHGIGMITTFRTSASEDGAITEIVLDERCPRLFAYFRTWDYFPGYGYTPYYQGEDVFVGTAGGGVYTKTLSGTTWSSFNSGLTDPNVRDLYVASGQFVCVTDGGRAFTRSIGDSTWKGFYPLGFTDESDPEGFSYTWRDVEAVACAINRTSGEIYIAYNSRIGYRSWVCILSPQTGNYVLRQVKTESEEDAEYGYTIIDLDTNMSNIFCVVGISPTDYNLEPTSMYGGDPDGVFFFDSYRDSTFHGEVTFEGVTAMRARTLSDIGDNFKFDGEWFYWPSAGLFNYTINRFSIKTEVQETFEATNYEDAPNLLASGQIVYTVREEIEGVDHLHVTVGDFNTQETETIFTISNPAGSSVHYVDGPFILVGDNGSRKVVCFGQMFDVTSTTIERTIQYIYDIDTEQVSSSEVINWDQDLGVEPSTIIFVNQLSMAPANDGIYGVYHIPGYRDVIVYKIDRFTGQFSYSHLLEPPETTEEENASGNMAFMDDDASRLYWSFEVDGTEYLYHFLKSDLATPIQSSTDSSLIDNIRNDLFPVTNRSKALFLDVANDKIISLPDGDTYIDYSVYGSNPGFVVTLDRSHDDRYYSLFTATWDGGEYWAAGADWVDSLGATGQIEWTIPFEDGTANTGLYYAIGQVLVGISASRIVYPTPTSNRSVLKTDPSTGFEEVFDIDEANNRDNLRLEISKESPVVLYGSETEEDSQEPDDSLGLMYTSATGNSGDYFYNVINEFGYGIISDVRIFDIFGTTTIADGLTVDPSGGDFNRYILFTEGNNLRYKHVDSNLSAGNLMGTFSGPVTHVETNNNSFAPHVFVSISGVPPKMFQRLNDESTFSEKSSGLPNNSITVIRLDDYL